MVSARTEKDKAVAIARLRSQLKGYPPVTDEYIERFLVARCWNVENAFKQIVATFVWRKENETDLFPVATKENKLSVLIPVRGFASIPDQNVKAEPGISETVIRLNDYLGGSCLHKTDKEGCPIYIERAGLHRSKKLGKYVTREEFLQFHVGCNEFLHRVVMKDCSEKAGRPISRETVIFDCTGMGLHQFHMPTINMLNMMTDIDLTHYPETLGRLFLVNTPSSFVVLWKIVKTWLDAGTIDKVKILGTDYQSTLLEHIPAENLPSYLGGTCTCDHMPGGCVPSQVLKNVPKNIAGKDNHKVPTPYNTDIMEKAKQSPLLRGQTYA